MSFTEDDDVREDNLERKRMGGRTVAIIFTCLTLIGAGATWFTGGVVGTNETFTNDAERLSAVVAILLEAVGGAIVAWRFHIGKGFFGGILLILLLILEIVVRLTSGSFSGVIILALLTMFMGKAVRAAWELRKLANEFDVQDTFA